VQSQSEKLSSKAKEEFQRLDKEWKELSDKSAKYFHHIMNCSQTFEDGHPNPFSEDVSVLQAQLADAHLRLQECVAMNENDFDQKWSKSKEMSLTSHLNHLKNLLDDTNITLNYEDTQTNV